MINSGLRKRQTRRPGKDDYRRGPRRMRERKRERGRERDDQEIRERKKSTS